jgi:hypothetical protein
VQVVPATNLELCTFVLDAFPGFIELAMGSFIAALKTLPILAAGSLLSGESLWGRAVKDAIAFDTQQATGIHIGYACQERSASIPPIAEDDGTQLSGNQQSDDRSQLASGDLSGLFRRTHTYPYPAGKLRAPAQLPNASTRLNRASLAFPKHR